MSEVVTCTPSSSRSNGARRRVMTSQRRPTCAAATRNLTGALSRETLLPERRLPVSVPFATTPLAVARKLVIFALIESVDDGAALADAGTANAAAATSAASVMVWDRMPAGTRKQTPQVPSSRHPCPSDRSSRAQAEARTPARRRPRTGSDVWHAKPRRRVRRRARGTPVWSVQACQSGPTDGLRHQGLERLRGRDRWGRRRAGRSALRRRLRQQRVVLVVHGAPGPCRSGARAVRHPAGDGHPDADPRTEHHGAWYRARRVWRPRGPRVPHARQRGTQGRTTSHRPHRPRISSSFDDPGAARLRRVVDRGAFRWPLLAGRRSPRRPARRPPQRLGLPSCRRRAQGRVIVAQRSCTRPAPAPVAGRWADPGRGVGGAHAVAQRKSPAYCRRRSDMSVAMRIRRSVRAVNLHNGWVRALLCSVVALVVAIGLLDGAAQGWVIMISIVAALFAATQLLDSEEVRGIGRVAPSTLNETTRPGSGYISSTGPRRPAPPPVGPVNTPRQDEIDALNRAWRASGNESP